MNNQGGNAQATRGKKLCVVTGYGNSINHGTNLQAVALLHVLQDYGYDASVIPISSLPDPNSSKLKDYVKAAALSVGLLQARDAIIERRRLRDMTPRQKKVRAFVNENFKLTKVWTKQRLDKILEETSVFISGSDQIWSPNLFKPFFFLDFAKDKKRVSYASSIGVSAIPDEHKTQMRELLMRYQHIGVREETAVRVLSELTGRRDIVQVLDPTFLLTKEEWLEAAKDARLELELPERFIFAYLLGDDISGHEEKVKDAMARTGIKDVVLFQGNNSHYVESFAEGACVYKEAGPKEFLRALDACSFVCTNSFHGAALSINFRKPFVSFSSDTDSRVRDVLSHFGLTGQFYNKDSDGWLGLYNEALCNRGGGYKRYMPFWKPTGSARAAI